MRKSSQQLQAAAKCPEKKSFTPRFSVYHVIFGFGSVYETALGLREPAGWLAPVFIGRYGLSAAQVHTTD